MSTRSDIADVATFGVSLSEALSEAHQFGHGPGALDTMCSRSFQERAITIYAETLPWNYISALGSQFGRVSNLMKSIEPPETILNEWWIVESFCRTAADVTTDTTPSAVSHDTEGELRIGTVPAIVRFADLAQLVSKSAAASLYNAARVVRDSERTLAHRCPLRPDQLTILRHLAQGKPVAEVANTLGYSTRSLYRMLATLRSELGVTTRAEGIKIAAQNSWLD